MMLGSKLMRECGFNITQLDINNRAEKNSTQRLIYMWSNQEISLRFSKVEQVIVRDSEIKILTSFLTRILGLSPTPPTRKKNNPYY